jgi:hypothetical protein
MITVTEFKTIIAILSFWTILWVLYSLVIRQGLGFHPLSVTIIELPRSLKCYGLPTSTHHSYDDCNNTDIDGFSLIHVLIYFTIGLVVPNQYLLIIVISYIAEIYEWYRGWRGRWWQDPLMNLIGYWLGSMANKRYKESVQKIKTYTNEPLVFYTLVILAVIGLYYHTPYVINFRDKSGK